jgi:hypothetical protein
VKTEEIEEWRQNNERTVAGVLSECALIDNMIGLQLSRRFTFTDDDRKNFHEIFFETRIIPFDARIKMYEKFLTIYEATWFKSIKIKTLFGLIKTFQKKRNIFAHGMQPNVWEFAGKKFEDMPYCKIYKYEKSNLTPYPYTKRQVNRMRTDFDDLRKLLATVDGLIEIHKDKLRKKIISGKA